MEKIELLRNKYLDILPELNERSRKIWAASESKLLGYGGIRLVSKATGIAESTIQIGLKEVLHKDTAPPNRIRYAGGGRPSLESKESNLIDKILSIADIDSIGSPESPLRWTTKSLRKEGDFVSHTKIGTLLKEYGFSLRATRKEMKEKAILIEINSLIT